MILFSNVIVFAGATLEASLLTTHVPVERSVDCSIVSDGF